MTAMTESATTERIRKAEKTVSKAREALDKAESGLRAAENVSDKVDEARSRPVLKALVMAALLGLFGFMVLALKRGD
jgi:capsule polysaccharide export protein KpsE/RkpR